MFMTHSVTVPSFGPFPDNPDAIAFCTDFVSNPSAGKYVFGRNDYARSIAAATNVDGFVDDYTQDREFCGKPILKTEDVPKNALVVSSLLGRPFAAKARLDGQGLRNIDYFAFFRYSGLPIAPIRFWDSFRQDFSAQRARFEELYRLFGDDESRVWLTRILNFRLSCDLDFMSGSEDKQHDQYFEDFLGLKPHGEIFVDVGGFDGHTSAQFMLRCPGYEAIHIFEPEPRNMAGIQARFSGKNGIAYYPFGLSDRRETLRFQAAGSVSRLSNEGDIEINVDSLDTLLQGRPFTFLKMDIEGAELGALKGAREAIARHHPTLAISVYHRAEDFWEIPDYIFSIRRDYRIYLRHYTEGIDETVMFFVPIR